MNNPLYWRLISFYKRPNKSGWYIALLEKEIIPGECWAFLALVWMPQYRCFKLFFNQKA